MRLSALLGTVSAICALPYVFSAAPAHAADASLDQDYLAFSAGEYDVLDHLGKESLQLGAEYQFHQWDFGIRPVAGVSADWNGMVYGYGGVNWDVPLPVLENRLYLTPSFMAGLYHRGSSGDLGGAVEFREGIALSYRLDNEQRIGLSFEHLSNAGIYSRNPGTESLLATYSIPVGSLR